MEVAALFRPEVRIEGGRVLEFTPPANDFHFDPEHRLVLFQGKEPNLHWRSFGQCILQVARQTGVNRIVFVGSFGGSVPHTRQPRLYAAISDETLRPLLERYSLRPSSYTGPGSFATYLMTQVGHQGLEMLSLVAEIPGYLQGLNPSSIEAVIRRLAAMLSLEVDLPQLRQASDEWESRVTAAVEKDAELAERIRQLEQEYDDDLLETGGKTWFVDKDGEPG
jgi:proteasome assembly chaperone (PAC2) family protein